MISPCVARADCRDTGARRLQRASEVGHGKGRHFVLNTKLDGCRIKRIDRLTHLRQQTSLSADLGGMCIEASDLREEDLALHVYSRQRIDAGLDKQCYLF